MKLLLNSLKHGVKQPVAIPQNIDLRMWAGIIDAADHFLGCDSVGQHIAYALDKTATVERWFPKKIFPIR